jgi:hypothetical protein
VLYWNLGEPVHTTARLRPVSEAMWEFDIVDVETGAPHESWYIEASEVSDALDQASGALVRFMFLRSGAPSGRFAANPTDEEVYEAVEGFFTSEVDLRDRAPARGQWPRPHAQPPALEATTGTIWWERGGDGWIYPWRITRPGFGYPSGEPRRERPMSERRRPRRRF